MSKRLVILSLLLTACGSDDLGPPSGGAGGYPPISLGAGHAGWTVTSAGGAAAGAPSTSPGAAAGAGAAGASDVPPGTTYPTCFDYAICAIGCGGRPGCSDACYAGASAIARSDAAPLLGCGCGSTDAACMLVSCPLPLFTCMDTAPATGAAVTGDPPAAVVGDWIYPAFPASYGALRLEVRADGSFRATNIDKTPGNGPACPYFAVRIGTGAVSTDGDQVTFTPTTSRNGYHDYGETCPPPIAASDDIDDPKLMQPETATFMIDPNGSLELLVVAPANENENDAMLFNGPYDPFAE